MGFWQRFIGEEPGILDTLFNYENKGQYGEYATEYALSHDNISGYCKTLHNIYVPYKGKTSEIDVLMVHEKGIFSFESKNYSGWIFGSADQQKWTQCLSNKKSSFYNPIKQNLTHCKALTQFLKIDAANISSYIIFSQRCELKNVPEDTEQYKIVRRPDMLKRLRRDLIEKKIVFSQEQVNSIVDKLKPLTQVTTEQKDTHVEQIKEKFEGNICPFCGAQLIKRTGKYGEFWGCTKYPKCRFTRKIDSIKNTK